MLADPPPSKQGRVSYPVTFPRPLQQKPSGPHSWEAIQYKKFWLEKSLEFWLEIPYTKKMFKNG